MVKSKSMTKRIFITGGLGYIGTAFAQKAVKKGWAIMLYDSLLYEQDHERLLKEIIAGKNGKGSVELVIGDTRNTDLLEKTIKNFKPDYLLHMAELSSVYACNHNPHYTEDINYIASKGILDICEKLKVPVLYNSTSSLYGNQKEMKLMTESDPLPVPTDNYCKHKLLMEKYIQKKVAENKNFKIIVFRPATVFGVSPRMRIELLPNHFTYCAVAKGIMKIAEMNAFRAGIDIQDLINIYMIIIEKGSWKTLVYNLGHHNFSKKQFADGIRSVVKSEIIEIPNMGDSRNLQIDSSLIYKEFDWKPAKNYKKAIKEVADWMKRNKTKIEKNNFAGILNMSLEHWLKII